jgi:hypothetical protein
MKIYSENIWWCLPGTSCSYSSSPSEHSKIWNIPISAVLDFGIGGGLWEKNNHKIFWLGNKNAQVWYFGFHVI